MGLSKKAEGVDEEVASRDTGAVGGGWGGQNEWRVWREGLRGRTGAEGLARSLGVGWKGPGRVEEWDLMGGRSMTRGKDDSRE